MLIRSAQALLPIAVLAACSGTEPTRQCQADADCGAPGTAYCLEGTCVANAPPEVLLSGPDAALVTHTILLYAAAATDLEGEAIALAWSVAPTAGGCPADLEPLAGEPGRAEVLFWCAGTYSVTVIATDASGNETVEALTAQVAAASGAPTVSAGGAAQAGHSCAGLQCVAVGPAEETAFPLVATASGDALTYEWVAYPPARAAAATASFAPSPTAPAPTVSLSTAEGAIAGDWRFRVRVRNGAGLVAQAWQTVTVGNRPPVLVSTSFSVDHGYDGTRYVVDALLAPEIDDPDGDPVTLSFTLAESIASGCEAALAPAGSAAADLSLACSDPSELIGGVERSIELALDDLNGSTATAVLPLLVSNRRPTLGIDSSPIDHGFGPCAVGTGSCFLATDAPTSWASDPDGDPLSPVELSVLVDPSRPQSYGRVWQDDAGAPHYEFGTPEGLPEQFRSAAETSGFHVSASVADPFGATETTGYDLRVRNRAPTLTLGNTTLTHRYDPALQRYVAAGAVAAVADPDGDPIAVGASGDAVCASASNVGGALRLDCGLDFATGGTSLPPLASFATTHAVTLTATDAWTTTPRAASIEITNAAVTTKSVTVSVEACTCSATLGEWRPAAGASFTYRVGGTDPEGDPIRVDGGSVCSGSGCDRTVSATGGTSRSYSIADGTASATYTVTFSITCPDYGQPCDTGV